MKALIIENINNPEKLEKLFQENKQVFCKSFNDISEEFDSELVRFWKLRLASETNTKPNEFSKRDLFFVITLSLFVGFLTKIPLIFPEIDLEFFYARNLPIVVFNGIILFALWQNQLFKIKELVSYGLIVAAITFFVNLLPNIESDSITLSLLHSPLLLWCLFCLTFISFEYRNINKRIEFIRFNGELLIMTGLILIAGGLLTAITIGLFSAIKMNIEDFYFEHVALTGGVAAPIVSFYLIRIYPNITSKIAPVMARVFAPLVLITLTIYLVSIIFSESKILENRDLLLIFNVMLVAVLAIIVFSVTELDKSCKKNISVLILFLLSLLAIVINTIALTAIITRVSYGLTPNRVVVLISNILIFVNLLLIAKDLYKACFIHNKLDSVEHTVAKYLTVYAFYTVIVVFILPFIFGFK